MALGDKESIVGGKAEADAIAAVVKDCPEGGLLLVKEVEDLATVRRALVDLGKTATVSHDPRLGTRCLWRNRSSVKQDVFLQDPPPSESEPDDAPKAKRSRAKAKEE